MHTTLIASIGKRDPGTPDSPTGPLRAARELQPADVILFATEDVLPQAEATRDAILAELPAAAVTIEIAERLSPGTPNLVVDIEQLLYCARGLIRRHAQALQSASHIAVCFTSGTPQVTTALTLAARSLLPRADHYQALNPDQATPGTPLLLRFDPDVLTRLDLRDRVYEALARCDYLAALRAADALGTPTKPPWNAKALKVAVVTARALDVIGRYAREQLRLIDYPQVKNLDPAAIDHVSRLREWLTSCLRDDTAWGAEVAAHALRLHHQDQPALAVINAAIAAEILITAAIRRHGVDPDHIRETDDLPPGFPERLRPIDLAEPFPARLEGSLNRTELLAALDSHFAAALRDGLDRARSGLAEARNRAVHLGKAPPEAVVASLPETLRALAAATRAPDPTALPTAPGALQRLAEVLHNHR